jgi:protein involved in temperature-dependent protein secretion
MEISEQALEAAMRRGAKARQAGYAVTADYDARQGRLVIGLNNGVMVMVPVSLLEGLSSAPPDDLADIEISPSGLGLHWPRLDADFYVPALLQGVFGTKRWMAAQLGASGGKATSPAKANAARENGRKGGRPRKQA